ncbi:hypothetical protein [Desulfovibrio sp. TomC]|uniref:hypothetical protein n=1 Tax=Desulfovibrio sp. TomC TaxID=1562888 RepID=UPI0012E2FCE1|nr:hypothetical protein [Desulfovibrio sp. TomC]
MMMPVGRILPFPEGGFGGRPCNNQLLLGLLPRQLIVLWQDIHHGLFFFVTQSEGKQFGLSLGQSFAYAKTAAADSPLLLEEQRSYFLGFPYGIRACNPKTGFN